VTWYKASRVPIHEAYTHQGNYWIVRKNGHHDLFYREWDNKEVTKLLYRASLGECKQRAERHHHELTLRATALRK